VTGNWDTGFQSGNMAGELSGGLQYRDVFGKWNQVPADKFIIHAPRGNSASFVRRGIMRAISRYWLIKAIATGDWASFVELFGIPYRKLTYPDNISEGDPALDQVIEAITMMGASGVVGLKKGWELELVTSSSGSSSSGSPHEAIVRWCDAQVSKNVLGQTLTTDSTQATGTYSLGVIHDEVRLGLAEDDAGGIAETTERDLFEPLVRYGLGPEYPVPRLALIVEGKKDPKTRADVISVAVNELGLPVTKATAYSDLRIDPPPAGIADEDLLEGKGETQPALFRGDLGTTIQRFIAEGVTGPRTPAQDALDVLAAQGAEDWRQIERESIPEAVAAMVRSNPNMTPDDIEARLVKMYLHQDPEEMAAVLEDTMNAAIVNGSLESELEAPTPKPDEEE
jgi:phage gp29-like protein